MHRDVVVIGASAGGVEALQEVVSRLPADLPASVLVAQHVAAGGSVLPQILERSGPLRARHAEDGDAMEPGRILVAPPDRHLIVYDDAVTLGLGPRENGHRPAIDVLFRSAARVLGPRVVSVVLSGALDDGSAGSVAVEMCGGVPMAQDPADARHPSMPREAIAAAEISEVHPVAKLADRIVELVSEEIPHREHRVSALMELEIDMPTLEPDALTRLDRPDAPPSSLSCPDCHGILFELTEGGLVRYRCRVGHAWSPASLAAQQSASLEGALWMAMRSLEEKATLARDLAERSRDRGHRLSGETFDRQADDALGAAAQVRNLLYEITGSLTSGDEPRREEGD